MRISTAISVPAVKHLSRRRIPRLRTGPAGVMLMLVGACALACAAATTVGASPPSPAPLSTLPVVVEPTPQVMPVAPPAPHPAPVATSPPGGVQAIEVPTPGILPPVAVLPGPSTPKSSASSVMPLGLLAAIVASLLIATGLTARRRL